MSDLDAITFTLHTALLELCEPEQYFETEKKPLVGHGNIFWWIRCYPNGEGPKFENYVSLIVYASGGGFELKATVSINDTDINNVDRTLGNNTDRMCEFEELASHETLKSFKKNSFVIQCEVTLENDSSIYTNPSNKYECILKFKKKDVKNFDVGKCGDSASIKLDTSTCDVDCYPAGATPNDEGYVSVYFKFNKVVSATVSCAIPIYGVLITREKEMPNLNYWQFRQCFSHAQVERADHKDNIVDLLCTVTRPKDHTERLVTEPVREAAIEPPTLENLHIRSEPPPTEREAHVDENPGSSSSSVSRSLPRDSRETTPSKGCPKSFTLKTDHLNDGTNEFGGRFAGSTDSMNVEWRTRFRANMKDNNKKYIFLFVEAKTTETSPVIMEGVIKVPGVPEKNFKMLVEKEETSRVFKTLISHQLLKNNKSLVIKCDAKFRTTESL